MTTVKEKSEDTQIALLPIFLLYKHKSEGLILM